MKSPAALPFRHATRRVAIHLAIYGAIGFFVGLTSSAAESPPKEAPVYAVAYVDVLGSTVARAAELLRQYRDSSRGEPGVESVEVYSASGRAGGFAILESWQDEASFDRHTAGQAAREFAKAMTAIWLAPWDVRPYTLYSSGLGPPCKTEAGAITVLVHVDVIPPLLARYEQIVPPYLAASRRDDGVLCVYLLQSRYKNHFTLVESWKSESALEAHQRAPPTQRYRAELLPILGALYDERTYRRLR